MKKIGLTGGIGSGKTTVANMFREKGVPVFIADVEAKKILDTPEVASQVADVFAIELTPEGLIHKPDLAKIVFNDQDALEQLNRIIHPKVNERFKDWAKGQDAAYLIYEAAIIFEKNRASDFDYTLLVTAPEELRIKRVMQRDKVEKTDVEARMKAQWPEAEKKKLADFLVTNTNLKETQQQVNDLHEKFINF